MSDYRSRNDLDREIPPENVDHPDPVMREAIARCCNTGKAIIGKRHDDGTCELREVAPGQPYLPPTLPEPVPPAYRVAGGAMIAAVGLAVVMYFLIKLRVL